MTFSGALTLTDLNDFITPSQACIKPVEQHNPNTDEKEPGAASTEIHIDGSGQYYEVSTDIKNPNQLHTGKKLEQAQISLNDCLACSGCITSAESILITLQSHVEVMNFLEANSTNTNTDASSDEPYKIPVISISPQSIASLATSLSASLTLSSSSKDPIVITPRQIFRRLRVFCTQVLGFAHSFDTTFARHLSLQEHIAEFEERTADEYAMNEGSKGSCNGAQNNDKPGDWGNHALPMLASACPGWVCYAEKAHSEMLPFIARTKSPQQIMGTLVKNWMGSKWGKLPHEIYHVTVMPCYDKKLEASRQDFYNEIYATRDVDCVITTGELELMMREKGWDLSLPVPGELDPSNPSISIHPHLKSDSLLDDDILVPELLTHPGTSSGSYLHSIIAHLQETSPVPLTLTIKMVRNMDYEEFVLRKSTRTTYMNGDTNTNGNNATEANPELGEIVFKGAKCYGFRNLQNVVRKVGRERGVQTASGAAGKLAGRARAGVGNRRLRKGGDERKDRDEARGYDYVEVMACPGGCVNGGGQLKPVLPASIDAMTPLPADDNIAMLMDEEGHKRDWESSGVSVDVAATGGSMGANVLQNARWGDKEWTKRVEEVYWNVGEYQNDHANKLARQVWDDLCQSRSSGETEGRDSKEDNRRNLFRTQYRAVVSEVIGLAVVW